MAEPIADIGEIVKLRNRTDKAFEFQFDGRVYKVPAKGHLLCLQAVGLHGVRRSICRLDPIAQTAQFRLGVEGVHPCGPLDNMEDRTELLDRGSGLKKTKTVELVNPVGGERASGGGRSVVGPGMTTVPEPPKE